MTRRYRFTRSIIPVWPAVQHFDMLSYRYQLLQFCHALLAEDGRDGRALYEVQCLQNSI